MFYHYFLCISDLGLGDAATVVSEKDMDAHSTAVVCHDIVVGPVKLSKSKVKCTAENLYGIGHRGEGGLKALPTRFRE